MENDIVTIRVQSTTEGINLLVYTQNADGLLVEHVAVPPTENVILATANRLPA